MRNKRARKGSIRTRLLAGAACMLLPTLVLGIVSLAIHRSVVRAFEKVVEEATEESHPVAHLQTVLLQASMPASDYLVHGSPSEREAFARLSREVEEAFQDLLTRPFGLAQELALVRAAQAQWREIRAVSEAILALPDPVNNASGARQVEQLDALVNRTVTDLGQIHELAHQEIEAHLKEARAFYARVLLVILAVLGAGLAGASGLGAWLVSSILGPLGALEEGARRLGAGDLSYRLPPFACDELDRVGATFNLMADRLAADRAALEELATQDAVTGLYNYREFHRRLHEEAERARRYHRPLSLLMLDLDHLKAFNDTYGHQAGDEALKAVAEAIRRHVRPPDVAARYGGDEFAVILPETPLRSAVVVAERIRATVAASAVTGAATITVSAGAAAFPDDGASGPELVASADRALYAAKSAGRNHVCAASQHADR
ncbi:MAG: diguanylate cyclase [Bacillota bacterium]